MAKTPQTNAGAPAEHDALTRGKLCLENRQWLAAAEAFDAAMKSFEGDDDLSPQTLREIYFLSGECARHLERWDEARSFYEGVVLLPSEHSEALARSHYQLARIYLRDGKEASAIPLLRAAVARFERFGFAKEDLGPAREALTRLGQPIPVVSEAPEEPELYTQEIRQMAEQIHQLASLAEEDPKWKRELQLVKGALKAYADELRALLERGEHDEARVNLALALAALGRVTDAREQVHALQPRNAALAAAVERYIAVLESQ